MPVPTETDTIIPGDFPELAMLVWNGDPLRPIPTTDAFALYENNWRHVDSDRLTAGEAALIDRLVHEHGNGFLLAAA